MQMKFLAKDSGGRILQAYACYDSRHTSAMIVTGQEKMYQEQSKAEKVIA